MLFHIDLILLYTAIFSVYINLQFGNVRWRSKFYSRLILGDLTKMKLMDQLISETIRGGEKQEQSHSTTPKTAKFR